MFDDNRIVRNKRRSLVVSLLAINLFLWGCMVSSSKSTPVAGATPANDTQVAASPTEIESTAQEISTVTPVSQIPTSKAPVIPPLESISQNNIADLVWLARFGQGLALDAELSKDGKFLAVATSIGASVYDTGNWNSLITVDLATPMSSVSISPDNSIIILGDRLGNVRMVNLLSGKVTRLWQAGDGRIVDLAFAPTGNTFASIAYSDNIVKLWNPDNGTQIQEFRVANGPISDVEFSPMGDLIAVSVYRQVVLWNVADGKQVWQRSGFTDTMSSVAFSSDGKLLAGASTEMSGSKTTVRIWHVSDGSEAKSLRANMVHDIAFSPDSKILVTVGENGGAQNILWDIETGEQHGAFDGDYDQVDFTPQATLILREETRGISIRSQDGEQLIQTLTGHTNIGNSVLFSPTDQTIFGIGTDITSIQLEEGKDKWRLPDRWCDYAAISHDGNILACTNQLHTIELYDTATGKQLTSLITSDTFATKELSFAPDDKLLAAAVTDNDIWVWQIPRGQLEYKLTGHAEGVTTIDYSLDGALLASGSWDNTIRIWDTKVQQTVTVLSDSNLHDLGKVRFSPNGQLVASGSIDDYTVRVWQAATGRVLNVLNVGELNVTACNFSPDGSLLVTATYDAIKVWRVQDGQLLWSLGQQSDVTNAIFSPDGTLLAISTAGTVTVWGIPESDSGTQLTPSPSATTNVTTSAPVNVFTLPTLAGDSLVQISSSQISNQYYTPQTSPDQTAIYAVAQINNLWQVVRVDLNGSEELRQITHNSFNTFTPQYSDTENKLLVASDENSTTDLFWIDPDSGLTISQLTDDPANDYYPDLLPDQSGVIFTSERNGNADIYLLDFSTGGLRQLTNSPSFDGYASISMDGSQIVFTSNRDGNYEIYVLTLSTGHEQRLTNSDARDADPVFSPDGQWIAFESNRTGNYEIFVMKSDGTQVTNFTNDPAGDWVPTFTPDGRWIVFQSNRLGGMQVFRAPFVFN